MRKKPKKKKWYTFMLVTSGANDKTRRLHIPAWGLCLVLTMLAVVVTFGLFGMVSLTNGQARSFKTNEEVAEIEERNLELSKENEELSNKVAILSDTVQQKVTEENTKKLENAEKSMPTGFPLSGTASMTEANANEAAGPGGAYVPMVIFESGAGTNVISTGDGTVSYVGEDDADYGNMIQIDHGNGYVSVYRNSASPRVKKGDEIPRGTVLFQMDETSMKLGYEILQEGNPVDPLDLLEIAG